MKKIRIIAISGIIAGTLDAIAAILLYSKQYTFHSIAGIFRFIARGVFGHAVQPTGRLFPFIGLFLHYLIALIWSAIYIIIIVRLFNPGSVWAKIILFGCLVWTMMNGFVIPIAGLNAVTYTGWSIMQSFSVILVCVSIPICLISEKQSY